MWRMNVERVRCARESTRLLELELFAPFAPTSLARGRPNPRRGAVAEAAQRASRR